MAHYVIRQLGPVTSYLFYLTIPGWPGLHDIQWNLLLHACHDCHFNRLDAIGDWFPLLPSSGNPLPPARANAKEALVYIVAWTRAFLQHARCKAGHAFTLLSGMQAADKDLRLPDQNEFTHRQGSPQSTQEEGQEASSILLQLQQAIEEWIQVAMYTYGCSRVCRSCMSFPALTCT